MIPSEGAGALLVARRGAVRIQATHPAISYKNRKELSEKAEALLREMEGASAAAIVSSANGTFIDAAESAAIGRVARTAKSYTAIPSLGEGIGASGLWQIIIAAQAARERRLPAMQNIPSVVPLNVTRSPADSLESGGIVVLSCGLNQQLASLRLCAE